MAIAKARRLTFNEYLVQSVTMEGQWELVNGELVSMPPESRLNSRIAMFLLNEFFQFVSFELVCCKDTEIEVSRRFVTARVPNLMILT